MTSWLRGAMPRTRSVFFLSIVLVAFGLVAAACSSGQASGGTPTATPRNGSPAAPVAGAPEIVSVTNPAKRGETASLTAKTDPNAACTLVVVSSINFELVDDGLGPATADGEGMVSWEWNIARQTMTGTATATVTCDGKPASEKFKITT